MKKVIALLIALVAIAYSGVAKPMETYQNYNVILVHGASTEYYGLDCDGDDDYIFPAATEVAYMKNSTTNYPIQYGASDMMIEMPQWLTENIFEGDKYKSYLQRPFSNPASSPHSNGNEIGSKNWFGEGRCIKRRSLIEEAKAINYNLDDANLDSVIKISLNEEEYEAKGKKINGQISGFDSDFPLDLAYTNVSYKKIPSRNIIIAHSMGGLASREYIHSSDYNYDVDKLITLDSPHNGTGSLDALINYKYVDPGKIGTSAIILTAASLGILAGVLDNPAALSATVPLLVSLGGWMLTSTTLATPFGGKYIVNGLGAGYDYSADDGLVSYLSSNYLGPNSVDALNDKSYNMDFPSYRLLGGKNALTISDPYPNKTIEFLSYIFPENITKKYKNYFNQIAATDNTKINNYNALAAMHLGDLIAFPLYENGTALSPSNSGIATDASEINDDKANVMRYQYNGAVYAKEASSSILVAAYSAKAVTLAVAFMAVKMIPVQSVKMGARIGLISTCLVLNKLVGISYTMEAVINRDLNDSHELPIKADFHNTTHDTINSFSFAKVNPLSNSYETVDDNPLIMESFLFEKPYVSLFMTSPYDTVYRVSENTPKYKSFLGLCSHDEFNSSSSLEEASSSNSNSSSSSSSSTNITNQDDIDWMTNKECNSLVYGETEDFVVEKNKIDFSNNSDWNEFGLKVDRWEWVDGVNGSGSSYDVPIRHVDRYKLPALTVTNFIDKYQFVVDDLIPQRIQQITMNFNFDRDLLWQCPVDYDAETNETPCELYTRSGNNDWQLISSVPHPVSFEGRFDVDITNIISMYNACDFIQNESDKLKKVDFQKDNQNTVTVSMVNKIGLSNSQRFYYLFKATANFIDPIWPLAGVTLSQIDGFELYASALDYQGFEVKSGKDCISHDLQYESNNLENLIACSEEDFVEMASEVDKDGNILTSGLMDSQYSGNSFVWQVEMVISNNSTSSSEEVTDKYNIPFTIDTEAPSFSLTIDKTVMNPQTENHLAQISSIDNSSIDVKLFTYKLEQLNGSGSVASTYFLPMDLDVYSSELNLKWDDLTASTNLETLLDGDYRLSVLAIDNAVPNKNVYRTINSIVAEIYEGCGEVECAKLQYNTTGWSDLTVDGSPTSWNMIDGLNNTIESIEFRVDATAPEIEITALGEKEVANVPEIVSQIVVNNLGADLFINQNNLLTINYSLKEILSGRDSAKVHLYWNFNNIDDNTITYSVLDSIDVISSDMLDLSWEEKAEMTLPDGRYKVTLIATDESGNDSEFEYTTINVVVDRTPPVINDLMVSKINYEEGTEEFSGQLLVSQSEDLINNVSNLQCYTKVTTSTIDESVEGLWMAISGITNGFIATDIDESGDEIIGRDTVKQTFEFDDNELAEDGKRYLQLACVDGAGNISQKTDLFYVGERSPVITSPTLGEMGLNYKLVAIRGLAPKEETNDEAQYCLSWRESVVDGEVENEWSIDGLDLGIGSTIKGNEICSNNFHSSEYYELGLWNRENLDVGTYELKLSVYDCETCIAKTDVSKAFLQSIVVNSEEAELSINSEVKINIGQENIINVSISGDQDDAYSLRLYMSDGTGKVLFDETNNEIQSSPFIGRPEEDIDENYSLINPERSEGLWYWIDDDTGEHHILWNGFSDEVSADVEYNSESVEISNICNGVDGVRLSADNCLEKDLDIIICDESNECLDESELFDEIGYSINPIMIKPYNLNKAMTLKGNSGHLVFNTETAVYLNLEGLELDLIETSSSSSEGEVNVSSSSSSSFFIELAQLSVNAYFGEESFPSNMVTGVDMQLWGFTIYPNNHTYIKKWDGVASDGSYPQTSELTLYAVAENKTTGKILKTTKILEAVLPPLELVKKDGDLPDFYVFRNDELQTGFVQTIDFGVIGKNANVSAKILNSSGELIKEFDTVELIAKNNDELYSFEWFGFNNDGTLVTEVGEYTYVIEATAVDNPTETASIEASFSLNISNGMTEITSGKENIDEWEQSALEIPQLTDIAGRKVYSPKADYLISANISGKTVLPENRVFDVEKNFSGTQNIVGYKPQRYSLGIKRQREELTLKIVPIITYNYMSVSWNCDYSNQKKTFYMIGEPQTKEFTEDNLSLEFDLELSPGGDESGFFYHIENTGDELAYEYIDLFAFTEKSYNECLKKIGTISAVKEADKDKVDDIRDQCADQMVWKLSEIENNSMIEGGVGIKLPGKHDAVANLTPISLNNTNVDIGCVADLDNSVDCNESNDEFNPNKRLFNVLLSPALSENGVLSFYSPRVDIRPGYKCNKILTEELKTTINLTIPDKEYWNVDYGYDNLVNKTIRLDQTNKTMFGSGGYLENTKSAYFYDGISATPQSNYTYGLLTPFETHEFNLNPLINESLKFSDEGLEESDYIANSRLFMKFYGASEQEKPSFQATLFENEANKSNGLMMFSETPVIDDYNSQLQTGYINLGTQKLQVFMNANPADIASISTIFSIPFPVSVENWRESIPIEATQCHDLDYENWGDDIGSNPELLCYKFYDLGSKFHYFIDDYSESEWLGEDDWSGVITPNNVFKNQGNFTGVTYPNLKDNLVTIAEENVSSEAELIKDIKLVSNKYEMNPSTNEYGFYISNDDLELSADFQVPTGITLVNDIVVPELDEAGYDYIWNSTKSGLYVFPKEFNDPALDGNVIKYYRSEDSKNRLPHEENYETGKFISNERLYAGQYNIENRIDNELSFYFATEDGTNNVAENGWIKGIEISNRMLTMIDKSTHEYVELEDLVGQYYAEMKDNYPIGARPKELITIRGRVPEGSYYQVSYLDQGSLHNLFSGTMTSSDDRGRVDEPPILGYFNVNELQGNTSILLSWNSPIDGSMLEFRKLNINIGEPKTYKNEFDNTVESIYGEVSVSFPDNSLESEIDITVRTVSASDYPFDTFNDQAITGHIIEVLPSMTFTDAFPRIRMKISKDDLGAFAQTPSTYKLYKVDFENEKFVPLLNSLYGFLDVDGAPVTCSNLNEVEVDSESENTEEVNLYSLNNVENCSENWETLFVTAETKSFSVFVALNSNDVNTNEIEFNVIPEIAKTIRREITISGVEQYDVYIDDDSSFNNLSEDGNEIIDVTPPILASIVTEDEKLYIDNLPIEQYSWLFLIQKNDNGILANAPVIKKVEVVPDDISCEISEEDHWIGLDNGYLKVAQTCNENGVGILQIRKDSELEAEISSDLPNDFIWDGTIGARKLFPENYTSRYIGIGTLGDQLQIFGPNILTDENRPEIENFEVLTSSLVLDKVFEISAEVKDDNSGVNSVSLITQLGNNAEKIINLVLDENQLNYQLTIPQSELRECNECKLKLSLRVEDMGHNYDMKEWLSESLYPYPTKLALWYPLLSLNSESAEERINSHDLSLQSIANPWGSSSGLYLGKSTDQATAISAIDLESSSSYSFEFWLRPGYSPVAQSSLYKQILSFANINVSANSDKLRFENSAGSWIIDWVEAKKEWTHLVISVSSNKLKFYQDGAIIKSFDISSSFETFNGKFNIGSQNSLPAYISHITSVRFYLQSLSDDEVRALFTEYSEDGVSSVDIANSNDITIAYGISKEFSCAVSNNQYWKVTEAYGSLVWNSWQQESSSKNLYIYARSYLSTLQKIQVKLDGVQGEAYVDFESVWRPIKVGDLRLDLKAGKNEIEVILPQGIEIAGFALSSDESLLASRITWQSETTTNVEARIKAEYILEGYPNDKSTLRPRMRFTNISDDDVKGLSVRYYFRGEDPSQVNVLKYYPQDGELSVIAETNTLSYVEWKFDDLIINSGEQPFWGSGPQMGINNSDYSDWNAEDDPSYVEGVSSQYVEAPGLIVLDNENQSLSGNCFENEDPMLETIKLKVLALDNRYGQTNETQLNLKVENISKLSISNYEVRYYFNVEDNIIPILDVFYAADKVVDLQEIGNDGSGHWMVTIKANNSLNSEQIWSDAVQFDLHFSDWTYWDSSDDPSYVGLNNDWNVTDKIAVFDNDNNLIYGTLPEWTIEESIQLEIIEIDESDPEIEQAYEYIEDNLEYSKTEDGFEFKILSAGFYNIKIINATGTTLKSIYDGYLEEGAVQSVEVNWTQISSSYLYVSKDNNVIIEKKEI